MKRSIIILMATLGFWLWAADDAAILPSQGVTAAPTTDKVIAGTDAITIPRMLSYQGKLTDSLGNPVPDGNYQLTFRLYTQETGGTPFWTEAQTIMVRTGLFSALLGAVNPISSIPDAGSLYLSLQVGIGSELTPRLRIVSSAYAYLSERAANADLLQSRDTTYFARAIHIHPYVDSAGGAQRVGGLNLSGLDSRYVDEGQTNSITSAMITDGAVGAADLNQMGASSGQVLKWTGSAWAPRNDSTGQADNAWVRGTPDSVLFTIQQLGIARGGADNLLYGSYRYTHTNLGVSCTTGTSEMDYSYCTVGGGLRNTASYTYATVAGGYSNKASGSVSTVGGGGFNSASGGNATVGGGYANMASAYEATVGGGFGNTASNYAATVAGGYGDTSAGAYSFTTNNHSVVPSSYSNSAAFNGQTATASNQTRVGALSKASGSFTIDHPLDPYNKILNHYFIEGPEMLNIYRGSVVLDASGRAEVKLPDYFSALNRNPHIQLTGVGTSDVYVAEDVKGNVFVIGGKPGTKVYWQVTGERQDVSAEATRRMMPVEQPKTGELANRMLDDDFLAGCMLQLEQEGKSQGLNFRTAAGRARYERMKNPPRPELERER